MKRLVIYGKILTFAYPETKFMNTLSQILVLLGAMGLFLYGMMVMSSALQKVAGDKMRSFLAAMTSNPAKRVLTGMLITGIIQSSTATTVMVVSFVNAGLLTLLQAVGVIMGANIGTTFTAWLISFFGFTIDISSVSLPIVALGFIFMMFKSKKKKFIGEFLIGFALLFLALNFLKNAVPDLSQAPEALAFLQKWSSFGFWSVLIFVMVGSVLTIVLQSSTATVALTLVMCSNGWISFDVACAMVLGENIGTTITANIAAMVGNVSSKRAALAHTVFNMIGVTWVLIFYRPLLNVVSHMVIWMGFASPFESSESVPYGISMLHTMFNLCNTMLLIGFSGVIVKIVTYVIKQRDSEEIFSLKHIHHGVLSTAELSLEQSKREIVNFGKLAQTQFTCVKKLFEETDGDKFDELYAKIEQYEQTADKMDIEIGLYLNKVSKGELSELSGMRIQAMYKIISELESLGDASFDMARILQRRKINSVQFDENLSGKVVHMFSLVDKALEVMISNLQTGYTGLENIQNAIYAEKDINEYRNQLREEHMRSLDDNKYHYLTGVIYVDLIAECERYGDFIINVSEAIIEIRNGLK